MQTSPGPKTFKAGGTVALYRRVTLDSSGDVVHAGVDDPGIGTVVGHGGASADAATGDHVSVLLWGHSGTRKVVCEAAVAARAKLYCAAAGKFDDDQADGPAVLKALEAAAADGGTVEAVELAKDGSALIYANVADSAEVENTDVETAFDKSRTIDGSLLKKGDVLEIIAQAHVVDNNSTDTLNLKLYVGTEEIVATGAVDVADGDVGLIHAFVAIRDEGASGKIAACGTKVLDDTSTAVTAFRKAEAAEDLSGDVAITVKATWSVAHADNEVELENLVVIHHKQ